MMLILFYSQTTQFAKTIVTTNGKSAGKRTKTTRNHAEQPRKRKESAKRGSNSGGGKKKENKTRETEKPKTLLSKKGETGCRQLNRHQGQFS